MIAILTFAVALLLAVLLSDKANRSVLSLAVLVLLAGFAVGDGGVGLIHFRPGDPLVRWSAELALVVILFTDGTQAGLDVLRQSWRLPARALLVGMPLTIALNALLAHWIAGLGWTDSWLLGAVLAPTDPVFAAALVQRPGISQRLRRMLNIESGLNDGIALPVVLGLLAVYGAELGLPTLLAEVLLGVALGIAVPWGAHALLRVPWFSVRESYQPLGGIALALLVFSLAELTEGNSFLAAFAAGITVASIAPVLRDRIQASGETVADLFKFAAVFLFGALFSLPFLTMLGWAAYLFALLALVAVRPIAISAALIGSALGWREWTAAAWFGPKGFSSVVYAILVLRSGIPHAERIGSLAALTILGSMIAHSSSDVLIARWLERSDPASQTPELT